MIGADLFMPGVTGMNGKIPSNTQVSIILSPDHRPDPWKEYRDAYHVANGITIQSSKDYVKYRTGVFVQNTKARYNTPKYRSHSFYEQGLISQQTFPPNFAMIHFCGICNSYNLFKGVADGDNAEIHQIN